jgi:hypothetical protein
MRTRLGALSLGSVWMPEYSEERERQVRAILSKRSLAGPRVLGIIGAFLLTAFAAPAGYCGVKGDVELVGAVADANKANREKITTWKGEIKQTVTEQAAHGPNKSVTVAGSTSFAYDAKKSATVWLSMLQYERYTAQGAKERTDLCTGRLTRDDVTYKRVAGSAKDESRHFQMASRPPSDVHDPEFDVFGSFSVTGHEDLSILYEQFKNWRNDPDANVTISQKGSIVEVTILSPGLVNRYSFDLSVAGNMVGFYDEEGGEAAASTSWTCEYENTGGVWLPKTAVRQYRRKDGEQSSEQTTTYLKSSLNDELSWDEFTLQALGAVVGDLIEDTRTNATYAYGSADSTAALHKMLAAQSHLIDALKPPAGQHDAEIMSTGVGGEAKAKPLAPQSAPASTRTTERLIPIMIALTLLALMIVSYGVFRACRGRKQ